MKERKYYSTSRLTTFLSILAVAIAVSVSLFTGIAPTSKVGVSFFVSLGIVVIVLVERLFREALYSKLERRFYDRAGEIEITRDELEQGIRSAGDLSNAEAASLRNLSTKELDRFTDELADDLKKRSRPQNSVG